MTTQRKPRPKKSDFITPDELASALSALDLRTRLMDVEPQTSPERAAEIARGMGIDTTADAIMTEVQMQRTKRRRSRARVPVEAVPARTRKISVAANLAVFMVVALLVLIAIVWTVVAGFHHAGGAHAG